MTAAITRQEAAARLGVSVKTVDRLLDDPKVKLTRRRVGRLIRIDAAEVEAIITGRKPQRRPAPRVIDLTA